MGTYLVLDFQSGHLFSLWTLIGGHLFSFWTFRVGSYLDFGLLGWTLI